MVKMHAKNTDNPPAKKVKLSFVGKKLRKKKVVLVKLCKTNKKVGNHGG